MQTDKISVFCLVRKMSISFEHFPLWYCNACVNAHKAKTYAKIYRAFREHEEVLLVYYTPTRHCRVFRVSLISQGHCPVSFPHQPQLRPRPPPPPNLSTVSQGHVQPTWITLLHLQNSWMGYRVEGCRQDTDKNSREHRLTRDPWES